MSQTKRAACAGNRIVLPDDAFLCIIGGISFAFSMGKNGAASVIRTRDLTLTKGALYRWSYGSIAIDAPDLHEIMRQWQAGFVRVSATA